MLKLLVEYNPDTVSPDYTGDGNYHKMLDDLVKWIREKDAYNTDAFPGEIYLNSEVLVNACRLLVVNGMLNPDEIEFMDKEGHIIHVNEYGAYVQPLYNFLSDGANIADEILRHGSKLYHAKKREKEKQKKNG